MFFQPIMSERDLSKFSCSFGVTYMQPSRFLYSSCGVVMSPTTMKSHPSIFAYFLVASVGALIVVVTMALRIFINKEVCVSYTKKILDGETHSSRFQTFFLNVRNKKKYRIFQNTLNV